MLERFIEQKFVARVRREGGLCPKFVSPGSDGWPDRLVLMPGGKIAFVELKAPQGRLRPIQVQRHAQLRDLGFLVFTVNDPEQIPEILKILCKPRPRKLHLPRSPEASGELVHSAARPSSLKTHSVGLSRDESEDQLQ